MQSISPRFSIDTQDFLKSIRAGSISFLSAFLAGALGSLSPLLQGGNYDLKVILNACFIAGITSVIDLIRRWNIDYTRNDVILQEETK